MVDAFTDLRENCLLLIVCSEALSRKTKGSKDKGLERQRSDTMTNTGGCLCGQVRYEAMTAPLVSGVCHCKNCQKQAGTAFSTLAAFQKADVDFVGELKLYQDLSLIHI